MSSLPPPPPSPDDSSASNVPPPGDTLAQLDALPPVAEGEQYQADVLKRKKFFSWKQFGGEGFLVSVAFHLLLLIAGIFWIVSRWVEPPKKEDVTFGSGSGGGSGGEKPKSFEHKLQQRTPPMIVKTPSRIVSKSATASIALPSTPSTSTASFASGLTGGGLSKGSGGGSGGGEGTGTGIGKGGGKNFVSLFGSRGLNVIGLPGTFYDLKQFPDGRATPIASDVKLYEDFMRGFFKSWDMSRLSRYFKSDESMHAERIFIPLIDDTEAPTAFGVGGKVKAGRWIVVYQGKVVAPFTGQMRFWGVGDDMMVVNWNGKNVLDSGYFLPTAPEPGNGRGYTRPVLGSSATIGKGVHNLANVPFRGSAWIDVVKGREYPVKIGIGEIYGGKSSYHLLWEKRDAGTGEGDGVMQLFRMSNEPVPAGALATVRHKGGSYKNGGVGMDVDVNSPHWLAKGTGQGRIR